MTKITRYRPHVVILKREIINFQTSDPSSLTVTKYKMYIFVGYGCNSTRCLLSLDLSVLSASGVHKQNILKLYTPCIIFYKVIQLINLRKPTTNQPPFRNTYLYEENSQIVLVFRQCFNQQSIIVTCL